MRKTPRAVPVRLDVAALPLQAGDDVPRRGLEQIRNPGRPPPVRERLFSSIEPADSLAHRVRIAHHEQKLRVPEVPRQLVHQQEVVRGLGVEHRRIGTAGEGLEVPGLARPRPVVVARVGQQIDPALLGSPDQSRRMTGQEITERLRADVAEHHLPVPSQVPGRPAGGQRPHQEGRSAVVRRDAEQVAVYTLLEVMAAA